ncbi:hypothetical protein CEXT_407901 [Caerostris extrusa]|uniref:Uncharacterized protein n=1 Tax=Caerostris extrusa TaxID=172846 RepID=A0AAV4RRM3_CAEEX|nr:hypothetical protein CEXT_407901 [Caerostris extrusa]
MNEESSGSLFKLLCSMNAADKDRDFVVGHFFNKEGSPKKIPHILVWNLRNTLLLELLKIGEARKENGELQVKADADVSDSIQTMKFFNADSSVIESGTNYHSSKVCSNSNRWNARKENFELQVKADADVSDSIQTIKFFRADSPVIESGTNYHSPKSVVIRNRITLNRRAYLKREC